MTRSNNLIFMQLYFSMILEILLALINLAEGFKIIVSWEFFF